MATPDARRPLNILVLAGLFKGDRFIEQCHRRGARVTLVTTEKHLRDPWPRHAIAELLALPVRAPLDQTLDAISYLARSTRIDLIAPMDDYDVEVAAALREHLRVPGMGSTTARYFRDKLAMRLKAHEDGIDVPAFCAALNHEALAAFMAEVPAPWMLKPRSEASAAGIRKVHEAGEVWRLLAELGDRQSHFLLERYVSGHVYHVDSLVSERSVVFAEVHRCGAPPFDVYHGGGVWRTSTVARGSDDERRLIALNREVLSSLGMVRGVSHTEFIKDEGGRFYFLETAARVGGAFIADLVECSTGVNLWEEWANVELGRGRTPYEPPPRRSEYGAVVITLARQEVPDLSAYDDPEIAGRPVDEHHAVLVLRAPTIERLDALVESYANRFARDFMTSAPARDGRTD